MCAGAPPSGAPRNGEPRMAPRLGGRPSTANDPSSPGRPAAIPPPTATPTPTSRAAPARLEPVVPRFNDESSDAEVLAAMRTAIRMTRKENP